MLKHKLIDSFLPVFNGFYSTVFEADESLVIEEPFNYDDYDFDYEGYRNKVAKGCVNAISTKLDEFGLTGIKITFGKVNSPKEYNFENDAIWVKYRLNNEALAAINKYLLEFKDEFAAYVKRRYTSRDGFMSFYSNDANDWFKQYFKIKNKLEHCFGAVLEFIFENEKYDSYNLYEDVNDKGDCYLDGGLKENVATVTDVVKAYSKENYLTKDITTITSELVQYFEDNNIVGDFLTYNYIEGYVIETFNEIENKTLNLFKKAK